MSRLTDIVSTLDTFQKFNRIKFYEAGHKYLIDGKEAPLSVTRLIGLFSPIFEREKIAKNIARSSKQDVSVILNKWEYEKDLACAKGNIFHNYVDNYLANKVCNIDFTEAHSIIDKPLDRIYFYETVDKLKIQFDDFYHNFYKNKFLHLKSEFVVGDLDDTNICGTIDNLSINKETGNLTILDYKTNKKIDTTSKYNSSFAPPIDHIPHCKLATYSLQIGIYKYIIEKHTSFKVDTGYIVWFNENNDTYQIFNTLDLDKDVCSVFNCYSSYYNNSTIDIDLTSFDLD